MLEKTRPSQLLPVPFPKDFDPGPEYFYDNFVSKFIPDMIRMMDTGLYIDQDAVNDLRKVVTEVLKDVDKRLSKNTHVINYQKIKAKAEQKKHYEKSTQSVRDYTYYLKPYKDDVQNRTWVLNTYLEDIGQSGRKKDKWAVKDIKSLLIFKEDGFIKSLLNKTVDVNNPTVLKGTKKLAEYKAELWNKPRYEKSQEKITVTPFNPGSDKQKQELFSMLNIQPIEVSAKTGNPSWGRDVIIQLKKEVKESDTMMHDLFQCFIDFSFGDIIRNNFIAAFDSFTINGVMHGNIKLFGAKSFRNTSNSPNLLNAPSTKSLYAKPLKRCFVAPEGYIVYAIDLSALEDRVIANLSGDTNKLNVFLEGLDGHSLNACGYYPNEVKNLLGEFSNPIDLVKAFMERVEKEEKPFVDIRQRSKAPTFKLAYGGFPDSQRGGAITQELFDNYHEVLYPGIKKYREEYVLKTTDEQGYLHLGLGCRIYSDNADSDIRTLHNATVQFWSILTLIAVNEINYQIDKNNYSKYIAIHSTIYDSIYIFVKEDPKIIAWINEVAVNAMCLKYLKDQVVDNEAEGEIGYNWADLLKLKNNASEKDIEEVLKKLKEKK